MNHESPWGQMVQDADGNFDEFLTDVNVDDFNNIDFGDLPNDNGMLGFESSRTMGNGDHGRYFTATGAHEAMQDKPRFGPGHPPHPGWTGPPVTGIPTGYVPAEAGRMSYQQHQAAHNMLQQQDHVQYCTVTRPAAVPPTPNSFEMHGKPPAYPMGDAHQSRAMYENFPRKQQQDQMVFTPLVSPAVTPLDSQFNHPEYTVPGEYFTPLTSPAMLAQSSHQRSVYGSVRGSDTSDAASPSDMEIDTKSPAVAHATLAQTSKSKKSAKAKSRPGAMRNSPAMKAQQRKKAPTSATITAKDVVDIMDEIAEPGSRDSSRPGSSSLPLPGAKTNESSSISPEPLSDILMPPPATPRSSKGRSPHMGPQDSTSHGKNSPATPATLMRLADSSGGARSGHASSSAPPARSTPAILPNLPSLRKVPTSSGGDTMPTLASAGGDGRSSAPPKSALVPPSPSASNGGTTRAGPKGKKRNSSTQPSPAIRPKISPSIKPLLPEGSQGISAETSALLLASKSNYQNILEGNHLPGVTYPNTLSANLTSKRTSHKLAEQGRRNRMNFALQELASLLPNVVPPSPTVSGKEKEKAGNAASPLSNSSSAQKATSPARSDAQAQTPSGGSAASKEAGSKASTVEMAIEFIKALQGELGSVRGRLEAAERALGKAVVENEVEAARGEGIGKGGSIIREGSDRPAEAVHHKATTEDEIMCGADMDASPPGAKKHREK